MVPFVVGCVCVVIEVDIPKFRDSIFWKFYFILFYFKI